MACRYGLGRLDELLEHADPVVDVLELAVLDVEGVATEARSLGEQDPLGFFGVDVTSTATV